MLIELYKKYQNQLSVKGARKKCIWETIAFELTNGGFPVDAEKCHQKWRNLEKIFRKHMHYLKSSRASDPKRVRQPPEYFDQLRPILSNSKASSLHDDLRRSGSSDGKYILLPSGEVSKSNYCFSRLLFCFKILVSQKNSVCTRIMFTGSCRRRGCFNGRRFRLLTGYGRCCSDR